MSRHNKTTIKSEKDIIFEYFRRIRDKDISGLLDLFTDDAVIYEPFSKSENIQGKTTIGLLGKQGIEPFLRVVVMANEGLEYNITIDKIYEKMDNSNNKTTEISAIITFERGDRITARFTFELICPATGSSKNNINPNQNEIKIKTLNIQFTN